MTLIAPGTVAWVCQYDQIIPDDGGGMSQAPWMLDAYAGTIRCGEALSVPGSGRTDLYLGTGDGKVMVEDASQEATAAGDSGDSYAAMLTIRTGHVPMGEMGGGGDQEGGKLVRFWSYVRSAYVAWTLYLRGGYEEVCDEESGVEPLTPDNSVTFFRHQVPIGNLESGEVQSETIAGHTLTYAQRTIKESPIENVAGMGFTAEYRVVSPRAVRFLGFGGKWQWGPANVRLPIRRT